MSVGHIARELESDGIATVVIAVKSFETRMKMMSLPRVLLTPYLLGRPMGRPFDRAGQLGILQQAVDLLENAAGNGMVKEYIA